MAGTAAGEPACTQEVDGDPWQAEGRMTDADDLAAAIREFEAALPGWWWTVGSCGVSRDASCGPDLQGPDADLLANRAFDGGFHCDDDDGTVAGSLRAVMQAALDARSKARKA
jgi:hypothetical protein